MDKTKTFITRYMEPDELVIAVQEASEHYEKSMDATLVLLVEQGQISKAQLSRVPWECLSPTPERLRKEARMAYDEYEEVRRKERRHEENQRVLKEARNEILPKHIR